MKVEVFPSELFGSAPAPGSKSIAQRMVACALLSRGQSTLEEFPNSDDCQAALNIARDLGAVVSVKGNNVTVKGGFPNSFLSGIRNSKSELLCGESGLASRMFTPIAALSEMEMTINGEGSLLKRSFRDFESMLPAFGVKFTSNNGLLPMTVHGPLKAGEAEITASESSQFLTGLLMALPRANGSSVLHVSNLKSKPYITMTLQVMQKFGVHVENEDLKEFRISSSQYSAQNMKVPGDWSGAAFLLVAGALCAENGIRIENLNAEFVQADFAVYNALKSAGVDIQQIDNSIEVKKSTIQAFDFDANDCPDLFPPLAALAAFADGVSTIRGVNRLSNKESNRGKTLQQEFAKANIRIIIRDDEMKIYPAHVGRAVINSHNDHRIAMAASILGLAGDRMVIQGAQCVAKSFPDFFKVLQGLNAKLSIND